MARRYAMMIFSMAVLACGTPSSPEGAPPAVPEPGIEPAVAEPVIEPAIIEPAPVAVNRAHACTSDADCADLTPIAPASWRCLRESLLLRNGPSEGPEPMLCLQVTADTALYCNAVADCPPGRVIPAYSENVTCTDHACTYAGHISSPEAH